jgi:hypothetical protein
MSHARNCETEFMAYMGFLIRRAEKYYCHTAAADKRKIILFILPLRAEADSHSLQI